MELRQENPQIAGRRKVLMAGGADFTHRVMAREEKVIRGAEITLDLFRLCDRRIRGSKARRIFTPGTRAPAAE